MFYCLKRSDYELYVLTSHMVNVIFYHFLGSSPQFIYSAELTYFINGL